MSKCIFRDYDVDSLLESMIAEPDETPATTDFDYSRIPRDLEEPVREALERVKSKIFSKYGAVKQG